MTIGKIVERRFVTAVTLFFISSVLANAGVIRASSCEIEAIEEAIAQSQVGGTVIVPPGEAVWTSQLVIDRGIILLGSGMDRTVIRCGFDLPAPSNSTDSRNYLISYSPQHPEHNEPLRISGFTFDLDGRCNAINLFNHTIIAAGQNRIDHNRFRNVTHNHGCGILVRGAFYGVIDNNVFVNVKTPFKVLGNQAASWLGLRFDFGTSDNIYIEDNHIEAIDDPLINSGWGGRYAVRFNEIVTARNLWPVFDMHGNLSSNLSLMGAEIYGNVIRSSSGYVQLVDHRGGKAVVFGNTGVCSGRFGTKLREEYDDALNPPAVSPITGQPQHVSESYYWNNHQNFSGVLINTMVGVSANGQATGGGEDYLEDASANFPVAFGTTRYYGLRILSGRGAGQHRQIVGSTATRLSVARPWDVLPDITSSYQVNQDAFGILEENREFWNQSETFDGLTGIGMGPLEARPDAAGCVPGVAYWATTGALDRIEENSVGINPATPLEGVLYRCIETDGVKEWETYYIPYPYPHPHRVSGPLADMVPLRLQPIGDREVPVGQPLEITVSAEGGIEGALIYGVGVE